MLQAFPSQVPPPFQQPLSLGYSDKWRCPAPRCQEWYGTDDAFKGHWGAVHRGPFPHTTVECSACGTKTRTADPDTPTYCLLGCGPPEY